MVRDAPLCVESEVKATTQGLLSTSVKQRQKGVAADPAGTLRNHHWVFGFCPGSLEFPSILLSYCPSQQVSWETRGKKASFLCRYNLSFSGFQVVKETLTM